MPIIVPSGDPLALWDDFYPLIVVHAPMCPYPEAESQARRAAREFCRKSALWRSRDVTLATTVAGQQAYSFGAPANAEVNRIHSAWDGDEELNVELPGEQDDAYPDETSDTWFVGLEDAGTVRITPAPDTTGVVVTGTVSYLPSAASTGIPQAIFDRWSYEIACGAIARIIAQPSKPWSNPGAVDYHQQMFDDGIRMASNDAGPVRRRPLRVQVW